MWFDSLLLMEIHHFRKSMHFEREKPRIQIAIKLRDFGEALQHTWNSAQSVLCVSLFVLKVLEDMLLVL